MTPGRDENYLRGLVSELVASAESETLEFKRSWDNPQEIGEYISALSNSAVLLCRPEAFMVWGVDDESRAIVGTDFDPRTARKGGEPLENWLRRLLDPVAPFRFSTVEVNGHRVVVLRIDRAIGQPVRFGGVDFVRIGQVKKSLKDTPDLEAELWRAFDDTPFEERSAAEHVTAAEVLRMLDYSSYFELLNLPLPENRDRIVESLAEDGLIRPSGAGGWDIVNLGAILFARQLSDFPGLQRKAPRVIQYRSRDRIEALREQEGMKGYASGFDSLMGYIDGLLPANELIGHALRSSVRMFPEIAVRELVANALIHQDFSVRGAGPMIEIFEDRLEITNPGEPLVDTERFVDTPPKSRNERLAALMRRFGVCEERGSGIDKVVFQVEYYQLPAPLFEVPPGFTRSTLFAHKSLNSMDRTERIRATYQHACLRYVASSFLTNASLRERFGVEPQNAARISKVINETRTAGKIALRDPSVGFKARQYLPFWA